MRHAMQRLGEGLLCAAGYVVGPPVAVSIALRALRGRSTIVGDFWRWAPWIGQAWNSFLTRHSRRIGWLEDAAYRLGRTDLNSLNIWAMEVLAQKYIHGPDVPPACRTAVLEGGPLGDGRFYVGCTACGYGRRIADWSEITILRTPA